MYIDDAMNEGAFVPEETPKRCKRWHIHPQLQTAIDGRLDLICGRCGAVIIENAKEDMTYGDKYSATATR